MMLSERERKRKLFQQYGRIHDPVTKEPGAYPWQDEFHAAGLDHPERMLMAGNRVGKTSCAGAEIAIHATGEYPPWWRGRRFPEEVAIWCGGETNETVRDVIQEQLLGPEGAHGTGWIPASRLSSKIKYRQAGVNNVVDQFFVQHKAGGISSITLKTYEQGVAKWRGKRLDIVWLDEEPEQAIYVEAQTRILDRKGILLLTATPHKGQTQVVRHFLDAKAGQGIYCKNVTWDDAPHLDKKEKDRLWESYPEHERETRAKGLPMMGAGAVFPLDLNRITIDPIDVKPWWKRINGVDFGINHPAAGAFCAYDTEGDTFYIYDCYRAKNETPVYHAAAMKKHGAWVPTAWPRDGLQRDKGSGQQVKDMYRAHGLYMLREHATYRDERGEHVEPGLIEMLEYMRTGRFKVFRGVCEPLLEELRRYHRDEDGKLVKEFDDIISAARYAFMVRRAAITEPPKVAANKGPQVSIVGRSF